MGQPLTVLLTNDDGIDAPGLLALEKAFQKLKDVELWVVAPHQGRSTTSHGMSLARPVFTYQHGQRRIAVDGLPVDCVYLAFYGLLKALPDVVVSGINNGANLGSDVIYSGTVAGAREAAVRGVHGVAASLVEGDDFDKVASNVCKIAIELAGRPRQPTLILNLNYPAGEFDGPRFSRLGIRKYPHIVSKREAPLDNQSYYWLGGPPVEDKEVNGTDGWLIGRGIASATWLLLDQTDIEKTAQATSLLPCIEPALEKV